MGGLLQAQREGETVESLRLRDADLRMAETELLAALFEAQQQRSAMLENRTMIAAIEREVQRVLDEWPHPGLCLGTSSYISPDVPHENVIELFRLMRTLGAIQRGV